MHTTFADTIVNIALTGPLVRIDLGTLSATTNAEGKEELRMTPTQQLVMPLEGFLRAFGLQENLVRKLVADGVVKPRPAQDIPASINTGSTTAQ